MRLNPALGRPFDTSYPSNQFILIATPVIGSIAGLVALVRSEPLAESFGWGFSAAGAGFLAWTIARELHPDRVWMATVATVIAPFGVLVERPDLISVAVVLLVARAVAGTTGRRMRGADIALFGIVGAIAAWRETAPGVLILGGIAVAVTATWSARGRWQAAVVGAIFLVMGVVAAFAADLATLDAESWIVLGAGSAFGLVSLTGPRSVQVGTDRRGGTIVAWHVRLARLVALSMAAATAFTVTPAVMIPAWVGVGVTALRPR